MVPEHLHHLPSLLPSLLPLQVSNPLQQTGNRVGARNSTSDDHDSRTISQPISSQFRAPPGKPRGTASKPFHSQPFSGSRVSSRVASDSALPARRRVFLDSTLSADARQPSTTDWLRDWRLLMNFFDLLLVACEKVALTPSKAGLPPSLSMRPSTEISPELKCRDPPFPQRQPPSVPGHRDGHDWSRQDGPQIGRADFPPSGFVVSVLCRGWTPLGGLDCAEKKPSSMSPLSHASGKLGLSLDHGMGIKSLERRKT